MFCPESFEAFPQAWAGNGPNETVWGQPAPSMRRDETVEVGISLPIQGTGYDGPRHAYQGDRRHTCALWLSACTCAAPAGKLER